MPGEEIRLKERVSDAETWYTVKTKDNVIVAEGQGGSRKSGLNGFVLS